jgi:hypothetical protein
MKAIINGVDYIVRGSDFSDTSGPTDPGMIANWTVYHTLDDNSAYGVLIDLGKNFGYRLVLRDNYGKQKYQEFTKEQVVLIPDN